MGQYLVPEYIQNIDPDSVTVYSTDIGGGLHTVNDRADRDTIPYGKRKLGMLVSWTDTTMRFDGVNIQDTNWVKDVNWALISVNLTHFDSSSVTYSLDSLKSLNNGNIAITDDVYCDSGLTVDVNVKTDCIKAKLSNNQIVMDYGVFEDMYIGTNFTLNPFPPIVSEVIPCTYMKFNKSNATLYTSAKNFVGSYATIQSSVSDSLNNLSGIVELISNGIDSIVGYRVYVDTGYFIFQIAADTVFFAKENSVKITGELTVTDNIIAQKTMQADRYLFNNSNKSIFIGDNTGSAYTGAGDSNSVFIGYNCGKSLTGSTTTHGNIFIGSYNAEFGVQGLNQSIGIGNKTLRYASGTSLYAFGEETGMYLKGTKNYLLGSTNMKVDSNINSSNNCIIGNGNLNTNQYNIGNIINGIQATQSVGDTMEYNIVYGYQALRNSGGVHRHNILMGENNSYASNNMNYVISVGQRATYNCDNSDSSIIIGHNLYSGTELNNRLTIGMFNKKLIEGWFLNDSLQINGNLTATGYIRATPAIGVLYDTLNYQEINVADTYYTIDSMLTECDTNVTVQGDSMYVIERAGYYKINCDFSKVTYTANLSDIHSSLFINDVHQLDMEMDVQVITSLRHESCSSGTYKYLNVGDEIKIKVRSNNTGTVIITHLNFRIKYDNY